MFKHKERSKRNPYLLSHMEPGLLTRIRAYAIAKEVPIYQAIAILVIKGLESEKYRRIIDAVEGRKQLAIAESLEGFETDGW